MLLHITNDFNLTKVHKELYSNLDKLNIKQKIFIPLRNNKQIGNNHFDNQASEFVYSKKINLLHRVLFPYKILYLYKSLLKKINVKEIELTHATTLFSDGAIALKLYKAHKVPYIVAVRNTDINFYFHKRKELIPIGLDILKNAKKIVFISESNKNAFLALRPIQKIKDDILQKIIVINNGINEFWLNRKKSYNPIENKYDFLFIGRFDKNKNTETLIDALSEVRENKKIPIQLHLVGGTGARHQNVIDKVKLSDWIIYHGEIFDNKNLENIFNSVDYFSMISHTETFGLVFIEALSQGKPLLYTKGQGVDEMFPFEIGEKVDSNSITNVVKQIEKLINSRYDTINTIDFDSFFWPTIAEKYKQLYKELL